MTPENLDSLQKKGIKPRVIIDTTDFSDYCESKHGYTNSTFHSKIWRYMCDSFFDGPFTRFCKVTKPKNVFEEMMNNFLDDYPEFDNDVYIMFTN